MRGQTRKTKRLWTVGTFQALTILLSIAGPLPAQKIATLEVNLGDAPAGVVIPVSVDLDDITHIADSSISLVQVQGNKKVAIPFQIEQASNGRRLTWLLPDTWQKGRYELVANTKTATKGAHMRAAKENGGLILSAGEKKLLRYQFETMMPPSGVNEVFKRSAFIHPLWTTNGHVLTHIQPPDHYHHYGLWNPWTHVLHDGDTVDFWNLNARQGTVRFSDFVFLVDGNVFSEYSAIHDHIVFRQQQEQLAIREVQSVRIYSPEKRPYYIADINVSMNCPDKPVTLLEYRYGGMGWRATEQWTKENSGVLTSEGKTRKDADGSTARWCIVQGTVDGENAGVVMMSYPANYNHPEPLRIWPENANRNRGDMFANFSPTKNMDWHLEPGRNYVLRYRFVVFDGAFNREQAEAAWRYFANPPLVKVTKG